MIIPALLLLDVSQLCHIEGARTVRPDANATGHGARQGPAEHIPDDCLAPLARIAVMNENRALGVPVGGLVAVCHGLAHHAVKVRSTRGGVPTAALKQRAGDARSPLGPGRRSDSGCCRPY